MGLLTALGDFVNSLAEVTADTLLLALVLLVVIAFAFDKARDLFEDKK